MPAPQPTALRHIHVLFKTHLDIGFTDSARNVLQTYLDVFIPASLDLAARMHDAGNERFRWTTGSWLIEQALEKYSPRKRAQLEAAIERDDICWHALPFTTHTELMDAALFRHGLSISQRLDQRFGRKTIAGKMTDVPGHTIAMVPYLAEAGVELLHIGVNPGSRPPKVPKAFRWRYGDDEVCIVYQTSDYGGFCQPEGSSEAIYFAHTGDNLGPCTQQDVEQTFARLRKKYPEATLSAANLSDYAEALRPAVPGLPVITQEIGDTWIHGVATDPAKTGLYRELIKWRSTLPKPKNATERQARKGLEDALLLVPEHTWGLDVKVALGHEDNYDRTFITRDFLRKRSIPPYQRLEKSWQEQRSYLTRAISALKGTPEHKQALALKASLKPKRSRSGKSIDPATYIDTPFFELGIDPMTGALHRVHSHKDNRTWADKEHPWFELSYVVYDREDYENRWKRYNRNHRTHRSWVVPDFLKPGVETAVSHHQCWLPRLKEASLLPATKTSSPRLCLKLSFPTEPCRQFGCPREAEVLISWDEKRPRLHAEVKWFDKQACRVPEAIWMALRPISTPGATWRLHKLGQPIDPRDVILDGARMLHAAELCEYQDEQSKLRIDHPHAPLVAPGLPQLVRFSNHLPGPREGVHFNLLNNTWGTNFPLWYEEDARFAFSVDWEA
ncbi:DUF5054 domain-containing protein [Ruficoccus sp. ZRK36]|uniref:DUF5054 domain-containing protein n=1 Tax=Ruficoccus sp. ZRK36 TaxID=2866311 RepID=UPI001C735500|nr:DUF5054 domain-containing protein [Ruficoccus sp. ZRK36]QYY35341.1 DUF5054 domain-containing protein [Ruficoccus sp. ZRK36]